MASNDLDDDELLKLVQHRAQSSTGWESNSPEIVAQRERALEYYKGEMPDVPAGEGLSKYVEELIKEKIHAVIPDIIEPFEEQDAVLFAPVNETDVEPAAQVTDAVRFVFFDQNQGYQKLRDAFTDALLLKTGYFYVQWQDCADETESFKGKTEDELSYALLQYGPDSPNRTPATPILENLKQAQDGTYSFDIRTPKEGRCDVQVWPPEDVAVSNDTRQPGDGAYIALRSRVSRGELLRDGYDPELVDSLPSYNRLESIIQIARDQAGEYQADFYDGVAVRNSDIVEIIHHYVRYTDADCDDIHYVVTGNDSYSTLLKREIVDQVPVAYITPFAIPHRHFGESMADKLIPLQRLKSVITRAMLNQIYYAQTGRLAIDESAIGPNTLKDLLRNEPGSFVRTRGQPAGAIQAIQSGQLGFEPFQVLEYLSTIAEEASGVARVSNGLNSDSLHDTASGALSQQSLAQRKTRQICREFAETGIKRLFLLIHDTLRRNATQPLIARVNGKFVQVDPTKWGSREQMSVEIGTARGGRDQQAAMWHNVLQLHASAVQAQGGLSGPLTNPGYQLAALAKYVQASGIKTPEIVFPPPNSWQPPPPEQPQPPAPDPAMVKVQNEAQHDQAKLQLELQKHQDQHQLAVAKADKEAQLKQLEIELRHQLEQAKIEMTLAQKADQVEKELSLKQQEIEISSRLAAIQTALEQANAAKQMDHDQLHEQIGQAHDHLMDHIQASLPPVKPGGAADE